MVDILEGGVEPCPFCGNDPISENRGSDEDGWIIICVEGEQSTDANKGASECLELPEVYAQTEAAAKLIWNTRHTPETHP